MASTIGHEIRIPGAKAGNQRRQLRASASKGTNHEWPKHGCGSIRSRLRILDVHARPLKAQRRTPLLVHTSYSGDPLAAGLAFQRQRKKHEGESTKPRRPVPPRASLFPTRLACCFVRSLWLGRYAVWFTCSTIQRQSLERRRSGVHRLSALALE